MTASFELKKTEILALYAKAEKRNDWATWTDLSDAAYSAHRSDDDDEWTADESEWMWAQHIAADGLAEAVKWLTEAEKLSAKKKSAAPKAKRAPKQDLDIDDLMDMDRTEETLMALNGQQLRDIYFTLKGVENPVGRKSGGGNNKRDIVVKILEFE